MNCNAPFDNLLQAVTMTGHHIAACQAAELGADIPVLPHNVLSLASLLLETGSSLLMVCLRSARPP